MSHRVRTEGSFTHVTPYTTTTFAGVSTYQDLNSQGARIGRSKTTIDVVTPDFHKRIARGEVINNPFQSWEEAMVNSYTPHIIRKKTGSGTQIKTWKWDLGYSLPVLRSDLYCDISAAQAEASTEAAAKVEETTVDGNVEAGEARETMKMFSLRTYNLKRELEKELKYANKRGYVPIAHAPMAVMTSNWLKYRYGIVPLLSLINDTLVVGSRIRTRRETARGFATVVGDPVVETYTAGGGFHDVTHTSTKTWSSSIRAGILYEYRDFGNKYGFSLSKMPRALWELTTLSFVMDWFANTGEFISALTPRVNTVRRATWLGYETEIVYSYDRVIGPLKSSDYVVDAWGSGAATQRFIGRRRVPFILGPSWRVKENAMREILTDRRIVDAFALTFQRFSSLMRLSRRR